MRFRHDACVFRIVASCKPRTAVDAFHRGALEADFAQRTSIFPGVDLLRDLEADESRAPLAEVREILFEDVLDLADREAPRPPRLDLVDVLLARQVVAAHCYQGLEGT